MFPFLLEFLLCFVFIVLDLFILCIGVVHVCVCVRAHSRVQHMHA